MARKPINTDRIDDQTDVLELLEEDEDVTDDVTPPSYIPVGEMSIRVPEKLCKIIQERVRSAEEVREWELRKWDKAFDRYRMCGDEGIESGTDYRFHNKHTTDENIVRENLKVQMRSTYMRNPHIEFTDVDEAGLGKALSYVFSFIMNKKTHPGVNMKAKAKRWIIHSQLTNFGVVRLGYQPHEGSRQEAVDEYRKLEKELSKAKTHDAIQEIEAKMMVLAEEMPLRQFKGLEVANVLPQYFGVDPDCSMIDLSDASWTYEWCWIDDDFIRAKFYTKQSDGVYRLNSNDSITMSPDDEDVSRAAVEKSVTDTVMGHTTDERRAAIEKGKTKCCYYYDRIMRRIYLFSEDNWKAPLYVWEDDIQLSRFFRHFILEFSEPIDGITQPGEVSFYIGQIDEINRINQQTKHVRDNAFGAVLYDKNEVDVEEVKKLIKHMENPTEVKAFAIGKSQGDKKISDLLEAFIPPSAKMRELYDSTALRTTIDRAANIGVVERGEQFKTNTTQDAVAFYATNKQESTGMLVDAIEEAFEDLAWSMAEIIVSKFSVEEIVEMVGQKKAEGFRPMSVEEFNHTFRMKLAAGSMEKPTSQYKRQEALQIAQTVGQFASGAPITAMKISMKMLQNAFTDFNVTKDDWAQLDQEFAANLQKGISTNGPAQPTQQ